MPPVTASSKPAVVKTDALIMSDQLTGVEPDHRNSTHPAFVDNFSTLEHFEVKFLFGGRAVEAPTLYAALSCLCRNSRILMWPHSKEHPNMAHFFATAARMPA